MKILGKSLVLAYLSVATGSAAQGVSAPSAAPSAVDKLAPVTQPLAGTLFFGQQQRDRMDRARKRGELSADGDAEEPAPSVLNGFVKRSDGQSAIWVDGQPRYNVRSDGARRLQPSDVGGSADTVKVLSYSESTPAPVSNAQRVNKVPVRKGMRKRPATKR